MEKNLPDQLIRNTNPDYSPIFLTSGLQHTFGLLLGFYYRQLPNVETTALKLAVIKIFFGCFVVKKVNTF
jgi:hypothetical protein